MDFRIMGRNYKIVLVISGSLTGIYPKTTQHYSMSPVQHNMTLPSGANSYKITT